MEVNLRLQDLDAFAHQFWMQAKGYRVFAFHGEMGSGKTTLIGALCRAKAVKDVTGSPTFSIINQYVYEEAGREKKIHHIDLYRLKDDEEIIQAGVEDCIDGDGIVMVEWPDKAPWLFDENTVHIHIQPLNHESRRVKILLPAASMQEQS